MTRRHTDNGQSVTSILPGGQVGQQYQNKEYARTFSSYKTALFSKKKNIILSSS